jgi:hypothetical protein
MTNFKDFFKSVESENKSLTQNDSSKTAVTTAINNVFSTSSAIKSISSTALASNSINGLLSNSNKKEIAAKKFSNNVSELVHSDEFLEEFSEKVGTPKESESEDEFVNRAKDIMRTLLKTKLSN